MADSVHETSSHCDETSGDLLRRECLSWGEIVETYKHDDALECVAYSSGDRAQLDEYLCQFKFFFMGSY